MDMTASAHFVTTAAFYDGTGSLYFSNGSGFLGGGQAHESIRQAAKNMVTVAQGLKPQMHLTTEYPLPEAGWVAFYLVSAAGVCTARAAEDEYKSGQHPMTNLYRAAHEIITQYRIYYPRKSRRPQ
jgi:hypothetical protein